MTPDQWTIKCLERANAALKSKIENQQAHIVELMRDRDYAWQKYRETEQATYWLVRYLRQETLQAELNELNREYWKDQWEAKRQTLRKVAFTIGEGEKL